MDKKVMVKVDNVGIRFNLAKERVDSLKEYFLKFSKGTLKFEEFWALRDVSLTIEKGDFYGLVGINGSGKSTLLKTVAGVFKPTEGAVKVHGTIMQVLINFNPLYWYIDAFRQCILRGGMLSFNHIFICALCAVIAMVVGCITFKKGQDKFILYI